MQIIKISGVPILATHNLHLGFQYEDVSVFGWK